MSYKHSVLITGGTSGLGYEAALSIARSHRDCLVVIASRSDKVNAAKQINDTLKQANVIFKPLDLSDLSSVRAFASAWDNPPLQSLILNAGLQFPAGLVKTKEGLESTFAINHVGHVLLFYLLFSQLEKDARVILIGSGTHDPAQRSGMPDAKYTSAKDLAFPPSDMIDVDGRQRYSSSKLANVLWTYALDRRLPKSGQGSQITVNAFDPGLMPGTGLAREYGAVMRFLWNYILPHLLPLIRLAFGSDNVHTTAESGASLAWLATSKDVVGKSGLYYEGRRPIRSSVASYDQDKQDDLWDWTAAHVAARDEEKLKFGQLSL